MGSSLRSSWGIALSLVGITSAFVPWTIVYPVGENPRLLYIDANEGTAIHVSTHNKRNTKDNLLFPQGNDDNENRKKKNRVKDDISSAQTESVSQKNAASDSRQQQPPTDNSENQRKKASVQKTAFVAPIPQAQSPTSIFSSSKTPPMQKMKKTTEEKQKTPNKITTMRGEYDNSRLSSMLTKRFALPEGWTEYQDEESGWSYYHNADTNMTTWERPTLQARDEAKRLEHNDPWTADANTNKPKSAFAETVDKLKEQTVEALPDVIGKLEDDKEVELDDEVKETVTMARNSVDEKTKQEADSVAKALNTAQAATLQELEPDDDVGVLMPEVVDSSLLPIGWEGYFDEETGLPYFHNAETGETTWDRPMETAQAATKTSPIDAEEEKVSSEDSLPPGWVEYFDNLTNLPYFYHPESGETKWEHPLESDTTGMNEESVAQETLASAETLPVGWVEYFDDLTNLPYFYHEESGETTWDHPSKTPVLESKTLLETEKKDNCSQVLEESAEVDGQSQEQIGLPEGWIEYSDDETSRPYFHNEMKGLTTWDRPVAKSQSDGILEKAPIAKDENDVKKESDPEEPRINYRSQIHDLEQSLKQKLDPLEKRVVNLSRPGTGDDFDTKTVPSAAEGKEAIFTPVAEDDESEDAKEGDDLDSGGVENSVEGLWTKLIETVTKESKPQKFTSEKPGSELGPAESKDMLETAETISGVATAVDASSNNATSGEGLTQARNEAKSPDTPLEEEPPTSPSQANMVSTVEAKARYLQSRKLARSLAVEPAVKIAAPSPTVAQWKGSNVPVPSQNASPDLKTRIITDNIVQLPQAERVENGIVPTQPSVEMKGSDSQVKTTFTRDEEDENQKRNDAGSQANRAVLLRAEGARKRMDAPRKPKALSDATTLFIQDPDDRVAKKREAERAKRIEASQAAKEARRLQVDQLDVNLQEEQLELKRRAEAAEVREILKRSTDQQAEQARLAKEEKLAAKRQAEAEKVREILARPVFEELEVKRAREARLTEEARRRDKLWKADFDDFLDRANARREKQTLRRRAQFEETISEERKQKVIKDAVQRIISKSHQKKLKGPTENSNDDVSLSQSGRERTTLVNTVPTVKVVDLGRKPAVVAGVIGPEDEILAANSNENDVAESNKGQSLARELELAQQAMQEVADSLSSGEKFLNEKLQAISSPTESADVNGSYQRPNEKESSGTSHQSSFVSEAPFRSFAAEPTKVVPPPSVGGARDLSEKEGISAVNSVEKKVKEEPTIVSNNGLSPEAAKLKAKREEEAQRVYEILKASAREEQLARRAQRKEEALEKARQRIQAGFPIKKPPAPKEDDKVEYEPPPKPRSAVESKVAWEPMPSESEKVFALLGPPKGEKDSESLSPSCGQRLAKAAQLLANIGLGGEQRKLSILRRVGDERENSH